MTSIPALRLERRYDASVDRVFEAWTDRRIFMSWFGPEGVTIAEDCVLDVRPGGAWRAVMLGEGDPAPEVSGVFLEVSPPQRLKLTFAWTQPDGSRGHEYVVTVDIEPDGDGARLILTQEEFLADDQRANHEDGWTSSFDCLARALAEPVA